MLKKRERLFARHLGPNIFPSFKSYVIEGFGTEPYPYERYVPSVKTFNNGF